MLTECAGKQVCVLGGNGFVGSALVRALLPLGVRVRLLSRRPSPELFVPGLEYVQGDLLDETLDLHGLLAGVEVLFNCAGELRDESRMHALHISAVERLIAACSLQACPLHWVQLSSVGVYGPPVNRASEVRVIKESDALRPVGIYETTKAHSDELIIKAGGRAQLTYSILRPSIIYGPGMPNSSLRQLIGVIRTGLFFYIGGCQAISTYVHVDDVVAAMLACGFNPNASLQVFNLSCDVELRSFVEAVAGRYGVKFPRWILPETGLRLFSVLFAGVKGFPLTSSRINALVARTHYPSEKIHELLGVVAEKSVLTSFEDVFSD